MIRHIVMWKLAERNAETMLEIKKALEGLKNELDVIESIEVGINVSENEDTDIVLVSEFKTREDLALYADAPQHKAVAASLIKPNAVERHCVDYEY